MDHETARNAAMFAYAGLFGITGALIEEVGLEKSIEIRSEVFRKIGTAQGKMLKEQAGIEGEVDAQTAHQLIEPLVQTIGIVTEPIEAGPDQVVMRVGPCPVYNAAAAVGWDPEMMKIGCEAGAMNFMDAVVKQLNPNLSMRLAEFREEPGSCCLEEIVIE